MTKSWTIYKIVSPSGKVYIGKASDYKKRMRHYKYGDHKGQTRVSASIMKHGYDAHEVTIIDSLIGDNDAASSKEMFWIRSFMSNYSKWPEMNGLNLTDGGEGNIGYRATDDTKVKLSNSLKEYYKYNKPHNSGKKLSEEQKKLISDFNIKNNTHLRLNSRPKSKEQIDKMVATRRRNGSYRHSEDTRIKMSQTHKKRFK